MLQLRKAKREESKIRLALIGGSGSGKSYSSLLIAKGLAGTLDKVAILDSEYHSADLYAHLGSYSVLPLEPPFTVEKYLEGIRICEDAGMEVIIIDSFSPSWAGEGGVLDLHSSMMGNGFSNWIKVNPIYNKLINTILQSKCHVIATIRSKQDYALKNINGKMVPEKVGFKGIARSGFEYDFTIVLELNQKHYCTSSKDRTGLFADKPEFLITEATGKLIKDWCTASPQRLLSETKTIVQNVNSYTNGNNSNK